MIAHAQDRHMLWDIRSDAGTEGYLVGSVHLLKPEAYPLAPAFDSVFAASDVLVFETRLDSARTQAPALIAEMGMYSDNQTLQRTLSSDAYRLLKTTTDSLNLPLKRLQRMEPWVVSMSVPILLYQRAGYTPGSGIDAHFFRKAKTAGKPIRSLETLREQLRIFDGLSSSQQEDFLRYTLARSGRTIQQMDEMTRAWARGDTTRLRALLEGEMMREFPALYRRLLVERNQRWVPQIEALLAGSTRPMIVVGAGHMVGRKGLIALLEARGYTIHQR
ncbi:TraB/GumN family protein [Salisaeta longa]|uniref:TraB/GumN family protein n=1 Tax=Salisaeta longa TaxID=503170 RepID=UPI00146BD387|nr:TraB/GumN family protein [Salisaeta longa]